MMHASQQPKAQRLFLLLGCFLVANALLAELIGGKIFSLEGSLGFEPFAIQLLGPDVFSVNLTAGVVLWPVVFVMTDVINEYYGRRGVRLLSYIAVGLIAYAFVMIFLAMGLHPADFWQYRTLANGSKLDMQQAFNAIFGQGLWIIVGSLVAFLVGQLVDVTVFHWFKRSIGKQVWLRATGSTLVSQFIDSFVVLFIAFYIGADWSLTLVLNVGIINYLYKAVMALVLTPVIYGVHSVIQRYLGAELVQQLTTQAAAES